jgi:autotransporter-associated beta strand protein
MKSTNSPLSGRLTPAVAALVTMLGSTAFAQLSITNATGTVVVDFDTTIAGVNNGAFGGLGLDPGATNTGLLDSNAWAVTGFPTTVGFGGTGTTAEFGRGTSPGGVTSAGLYAFTGGNITTGVALGIQPTAASWTPGSVTLRVKNDTASLITGFSLSYKLWVNNNEARSNSFNFLRSADDVSYTPEPTLDFTSAAASDSNGFSLVTRSLTISNLAFATGDFYYLRWAGDDVGGSGSRDEFAIDDIQLSLFTTGVAGRNLVWSPVTGVWDTSSQNWLELGVPATFQANDSVTFDDAGIAGGATVSVQTAGVTSGNIKVTNTTGTYSFVGGAISGSGSLTKTGAGKLILAAANSFSGGTTINEGTVSVSDDAQLGAANGTILLGASGTFETTGSVTINASRPFTGTGTLNIAPSTTLMIAGNVSTGALTLANTGALTFSGTNPAQVGTLTFQQPTILSATLPVILNGGVTTAQSSGTVSIAASLNLGSALRVFNIADGPETVDASISGALTSGTAGGRLHKLGDGTLELLGDNSGMIGGIRLGTAGSSPVTGGTLRVNAASNLGPGGTGTAGAFQFNAGTLLATAPIQFPVSLSLSLGSSSPLPARFSGADVEFLGAPSFFLSGGAPHLIIADSNVKFTGLLTGSTAGLTVRGTGSLTLAGGGTFTGDIGVEAGKLFITGNIAGTLPVDNRPSITASAGGTLGGSVSGSDSLGPISATGSSGIPGIISPGTPSSPISVLTTTSLTLFPDGLLAMEIGGVSENDYDRIVLNGTAFIRGALSISLFNGFTPIVGDSFTLIANDDVEPLAPEDLFIGKPDDSLFTASGYEFRIDYQGGDGNDVTVTVTIPEPASAALLFGGLGLLALRRRRSPGYCSSVATTR